MSLVFVFHPLTIQSFHATPMKPHATIKIAVLQTRNDHQVVAGFCTSHDARPDLVGRWIHTSRVLKVEDDKVETLNTIYYVEWESPYADIDADNLRDKE